MAAWLVLAAVCGGLMGGMGVAVAMGREIMRLQDTSPNASSLLSDELAAKMIERLLDTSLPTMVAAPPEDEMGVGAPHDPGELDDSEWAGARDWTDNLFGEERSTVGRLAPGESPIPSDPVARWRMMGDGAFDEWSADGNWTTAEQNGAGSWVQPIDLGNGEMVE